MDKKRGQMNISFGMIFSILLIVFFIAFAFYGIKKFLGFQDTIKIEKFLDDLQSDVDRVWRGSQASQEKEYYLPKKIEAVCFRAGSQQNGYQNLFFRSSEILREDNIEHINTEKITEDEEPFCIQNIQGKIALTLEKDFGETLVNIR